MYTILEENIEKLNEMEHAAQLHKKQRPLPVQKYVRTTNLILYHKPQVPTQLTLNKSK